MRFIYYVSERTIFVPQTNLSYGFGILEMQCTLEWTAFVILDPFVFHGRQGLNQHEGE